MSANFIHEFFLRLKRRGQLCSTAVTGSPMAGRRFLQIILGVVLGYIVMSFIVSTLGGDQTINLTAVLSENKVIEDLRRGINGLADHHQVQNSLTERPVRVMVIIITGPKNWKKVDAVRQTWGKRIKHIFVTSKSTPDETDVNASRTPHNDTIELDVQEGRQHLVSKSMLGFKYMYENHLDDADWFMKADDDTYVIVENLRHFLSQQNSSEPVYFGQIFLKYIKQGYNSGGAGYVLSKEALTRMFAVADPKHVCKTFEGAEDVTMGKCMSQIGVQTRDTVDESGRSRFHCFFPELHMFGPFLPWYPEFDKYDGKANISDHAITFHYMQPNMMVMFDLYLYTLSVHGE